MILGTLQYPSRYGGLGDNVRTALKFLIDRDLSSLPLGRHTIEKDDVSMELVEVLTVTHGTKLFEAHEKYIDIHLTLSGEEWYGYVPTNNVAMAEEYNAEKDVALYKGEGVYFQVPKGQFVLFFPEDAHKPCVTFGHPALIKKLVVKIRL